MGTSVAPLRLAPAAKRQYRQPDSVPMPRPTYMLAILLVPACAASNSAVRPSSAQASTSDSQRGTQTKADSSKYADQSVEKNPSSEQPPDEEVPEWLKKKPEGDPSAEAVREQMAEEHRHLLRLFDDEAATINLADGVDAAEAEFIGNAYFGMKFGECGTSGKATDGGREWLMHPRIGVSGQPLSDVIRVDKRTGAIRYGSGATTEASAAIEFERGRLQKNVELFSKRTAVR